MRQHKHLHIATLVLAYLASLVLLIADHTSFDLSSFTKTEVHIKSQDQNPSSETKDQDQEGQTYIQELSAEAVFSILYIPMGYPTYLRVALDFPLVEDINFAFDEAQESPSYLLNIFCHLIAINAP